MIEICLCLDGKHEKYEIEFGGYFTREKGSKVLENLCKIWLILQSLSKVVRKICLPMKYQNDKTRE